jgi:nitroreductase
MQTNDAIASRRNVRSYDGRPVGREQLDQILEAGRRAPSSRNTQPWDFVLVTDRDQLLELSTVWVGGGHIAGSAGTVAIVVDADAETRQRAQFDLGQATMSIMLAAADAGVGSCHSAVGDEELAGRLLGLPAGKTCAFLISLGYPAGRPLAPITRPDRRPFDEVVHREHW